MKIAIIGAGVSGLVSAYLLHRRHEIVVFEARPRVGGHAETHAVRCGDQRLLVDTGFVVFNVRNYPNFVRLLDRLNVSSQPTSMSFSVASNAEDFEYCGNTLNTFFAQRRNLLRPSHYRMLGEILRFNRQAVDLVEQHPQASLGELLRIGGFHDRFVDRYLIPMGAAVWSTDPETMMEFPARFLVRFFANHGMLDVAEQPDWRTVRGGSVKYVEAITAPFKSSIRLNSPVNDVRRTERGVEVLASGAARERFDHVVFATHADQTLRMLSDPSERERELLQEFPYQKNDTVLHTDTALLPKRRRAWASWNYRIPKSSTKSVVATYNMNRLQALESDKTFCTTLNATSAIDRDKILARMDYAHPVFLQGSVQAQERHHEISGIDRTHYCGAYWGHGFHEDGVSSALRVCERFGESL